MIYYHFVKGFLQQNLLTVNFIVSFSIRYGFKNQNFKMKINPDLKNFITLCFVYFNHAHDVYYIKFLLNVLI